MVNDNLWSINDCTNCIVHHVRLTSRQNVKKLTLIFTVMMYLQITMHPITLQVTMKARHFIVTLYVQMAHMRQCVLISHRYQSNTLIKMMMMIVTMIITKMTI